MKTSKVSKTPKICGRELVNFDCTTVALMSALPMTEVRLSLVYRKLATFLLVDYGSSQWARYFEVGGSNSLTFRCYVLLWKLNITCLALVCFANVSKLVTFLLVD